MYCTAGGPDGVLTVPGCAPVWCLCRKIGLSLGWVYLFMGVVVGSAVPPIAFCITWNKISAAGAIGGAVTGLVGAIITWICTAKVSVVQS
jgi:Na+/proline symporter